MAGRGRTISYKIKFTRIAVEFYEKKDYGFVTYPRRDFERENNAPAEDSPTQASPLH